ncbi:succinate dehydrogenase cytochrome b560 subunit, mitochondrial-like [Lineus longissimus]|uniref:succinate dehydrogenase cytochrome b560 subunit, mitochondrial-like n=1 Tax=Lineus longissimus TaxID=88925 RepID=UPI002B4DFFDB
MALSTLRIAGRFSASALLRQRAPIFMTRVVAISSNRIAIEEQKQFWELNEVTLKRPQSPHLSIYKPQLTSVLSLIHRGSGILMGLALYLITYTVTAMPHDFTFYIDFIKDLHLNPYIFTGTKFLMAFPLVYHMINGVRHMAWDCCIGFGLPELYRSGKFVLTLAFLVTAGIVSQ